MTYHLNVLSHSWKFSGSSFSLNMYITQQSSG